MFHAGSIDNSERRTAHFVLKAPLNINQPTITLPETKMRK